MERGFDEIHSRSVGNSRRDDLQQGYTDTKIKGILMSKLVTNPDDLLSSIKDISCHRTRIVRSEKLPVYVVVEKAFIEQVRCNHVDLEQVSVNIVFRDCRAPATIGRYHPNSVPCRSIKRFGNDDEISDLKAESLYTVTLPDGSFCFIIQTTVGEGVYDEIQICLEFPDWTSVSAMILLDIDDPNAFKSVTPAGNFLKTLSRNEYSLQERRRYYSTLKVEVVEPVQVGWDRHSLHSSTLWFIRVRNRLRDGSIVILRINLLFDQIEESLICLNDDWSSIHLQPDEVYCFVYSVASSCQHIPTASILLTSEIFCSSVVYQVQLVVTEKESAWLNMSLDCPSEVANHSTFAVAATITNVGQTISDLEICLEQPSTIDSVIKPYNYCEFTLLGTT